MPTLEELLPIFSEFAPQSLAEPWDNVGLQLGDKRSKINRMLLSLNATQETIEEAIQKKCELLFTHHPLFFEDINSIVNTSALFDVIKDALAKNIGIYSAHTNLDKSEQGINKVLADYLELKKIEPLIADTDFKKLVFFVETKYSKKIIEELALLGAGKIGQYSNASFRSKGVGTFKPEAGAKPAVGEKGVVNEVGEERVEMLVHQSILVNVVKKLIETHPYEEVAYDIYPIEGIKKSNVGLGRIGDFSSQKRICDIIADLRQNVDGQISVLGNPEKKVRRAAILAGAGASYIEQTGAKGAELFITSDVKYHEAQKAAEIGLNLIILSHFAIEKFALNLLAPLLADKLNKSGYSVDVIISEKESDVWFEN